MNSKAHAGDHGTAAHGVWKGWHLAGQLIHREIVGRYRGSVLGILWSLLTPLFMLAVYTFVFGTIFKARWSEGDTTTSEFAILLFSGLVPFQLFSEVVNRAPGLVLANTNYVKKVVFPLEILPVVALGSSLFHACVSLVVLFGFMLAFMGSIPATACLLPVIWTPFLLMTLGLAWFLASLGVYFRDISQFLGTLVTALMFLSPIFFPTSALPDWLRPYLFLNPLTLPIEQTRAVLIWGLAPDFAALAAYAVAAIVVASLGYTWFEKTRKGFADVL
jgi:lipopolysaccharide transport system permease protein